jgi:hypothetical protein
MWDLPPRAFWTLPDVATRWGCRLEDLAAWSAAEQLAICTSIRPVMCGNEVVSGLVAIPTTDLLPMFRRDGSGPDCCQVARVRRTDDPGWLFITNPSDGVPVEKADFVVMADEMIRFEEEHSIYRRRSAPAVAVPVTSSQSKYDWDAMWVHVLQRVHEQGLPETQREFVNEIQDWFIRRSDDGDAPDERTIRRRLTPAWRTLRAEDED